MSKNLSKSFLLKTFLALILILFLAFCSLPLFSVGAADRGAQYSSVLDDLSKAYASLKEAISLTAIREHMIFFSSLGTRAVGYEGNLKAAKYIYSKFKEYGLINVTYHTFSLVDAIDYGTTATLENGQVLRLYPIKPNFVCTSQTPPEGISGKIVYAGAGWLEDFEKGAKEANTPVEGNIVLLDWYTLNRWTTALRLGAKAVIFLHPSILSFSAYGAFDTKYLPELPLYYPRYYAGKEETAILLQNVGKRITIRSEHKWSNVTSWNILGYVPGTLYPDRIIIISSYYDSCSVAPSCSPGAEESVSISTLLEVAKFFSKNPPKNTILFVAFSGHHNDLRGSICFANDFLVYPSYNYSVRQELFKNIGLKFKILINIDVSMGSPTLYFIVEGNEFRLYTGDTTWQGIFRGVGSYIQLIVGRVMSDKPFGRTYQNPEYCPMLISTSYSEAWEGRILSWKDFIYDHEVFPYCYLPAYTISTAYDPRPQHGEPFDTMEWVDSRVNGWDNLQAQIELIFPLLYAYANEDNISNAYTGWWKRDDPRFLPGFTAVSVVGQTGIFRPEKGYYEPIPNAIVYLRVQVGNQRTGYYYKRIFTFSDGNGTFRIWPVPSYYFAPKFITAFVVDDRTGKILYAPDSGMHAYMPRVLPGVLPYSNFGWLALFRAASIVFDTISSTRYLEVMTHDTKIKPESFDEWEGWGITVLFVPPEVSIEITWFMPPGVYPYAILNNATEENPMGAGYKLRHGEQLIIPNVGLKYAENLYRVNQERLYDYAQYEPEILKTYVEEYHKKSYELLQLAYHHLRNFEYSRVNALSTEARYFAGIVYSVVRQKMEDSCTVVPIMAALLLPFVFLSEKLIFACKGYKRIISFMGIYAVTFLIFYFIHPGFKFTANPLMIVLGFTILTLSSPVIFMTFISLRSYMDKVRRERLGIHEVKVGRASQISHAFSVGVENMRRLKFRTTSTLISVIIMIACLLNIVSMSSLTVTHLERSPGTANYQGIYIRKYLWGEGSFNLGEGMYQLLKDWYKNEATIAPRAWRYSAFYSSLLAWPQRVGFKLYYGDKWINAIVLWGLTPMEREFLKVDFFLVAGRWFEPTDRRAVILNLRQAESLGINVSELNKGPVPVVFEGMQYYVVGVIDMALEHLKEMDGEEITPLKFDLDYNPYFIHVTLDYTLILTYEDVINLGGGIASISIKFNDPSMIREAAEKISKFYSAYLTYFTEFNKETGETMIYIISSRFAHTFLGLEFQLVPTIIVILSLFNTVMGSVHERRREISIYSVVGLSPLHVSMMFLAESLIYALLGGVLGYLSAISFFKVASLFLPTELIAHNYSSRAVMIALGLSMLATVLASTYPSIIAGRLVTPSLERTWKITTKPKGDMWEVPLPFIFKGYADLAGFLRYIEEYIEEHKAPDSPDFSMKEMSVSKGEIEGKRYVSIESVIKLAPYEAGVAEKVQIYLIESESQRWEMHIFAQKLMGPSDRWVRLHRNFIDQIRKQIMLWKSLPPTERQRYMKGDYEEKSIR